MSTVTHSHSVVIPTLGLRPVALLRLLQDLASQSTRLREILLVTPDDNLPLLLPLVDGLTFDHLVKVIPGRRGTATQRNVGLSHATSDLVHFLDDDVRIEADYIAAIDRAFNDPETVGAMGNLVDLVPRTATGVRRILRRMALAEPGQGLVGRSGINQPVRDREEDRWVEWMSGGAMSLRRSVAQDVRFDEGLEDGPTGAYALGEDVDFSYRVASRGSLRFVSRARVFHPAAPSGDLGHNDPLFHEMRALSRRYLVAKHAHQLSVVALRWSQAMELAWLCYRCLRGRLSKDCVIAFARGAWLPHPLLDVDVRPLELAR